MKSSGYSVENKEEAVHFNRIVYDGEFGNNYDANHISDSNHYRQKIFYKNLQKIFSDLSKREKKLTLIDVGTGTGALSLNYYKFIRPKDTVVNLDLSSNMLNLLKQKLTNEQVNQSNFICDDAYSYFSKTESRFDLIGFAGTLHHFYDYKEVIEIACKLLAEDGYIYIALEPANNSSYFERLIRNIESIISRYKKKEFGIFRCILKIAYSPFHFINSILGIEKNNQNEGEDPDQMKSEVITSGLDMPYLKKTLEFNNIKIVQLSGGPDYIYELTYKILNFFGINSHFQLIGKKENNK